METAPFNRLRVLVLNESKVILSLSKDDDSWKKQEQIPK